MTERPVVAANVEIAAVEVQEQHVVARLDGTRPIVALGTHTEERTIAVGKGCLSFFNYACKYKQNEYSFFDFINTPKSFLY